MVDRAADQRLVDAIYSTLMRYGVRLPPQHERADMDERIELMRKLSGHVAKAVAGALEETKDTSVCSVIPT